jgi:hypothetical protein
MLLMQRRSLLKLGAATGLLLAIAGTGLALYRPGWQDGQLTEAGRAMFGAVCAAVLDGFLPKQPAQRQAALDAHLRNLQATLTGLPAALQAEVAQLSAVLCSPPGRRALAGLSTDWAQAEVSEVQQALQDMRLSSLALRQQAYHALRDLTNAAWFADPSSWPAIGYPGPQAV